MIILKINLFFWICLFFCCCTSKGNIVGKYMSKNNPNYIQLKKDSTFIYEYRYLHLYQQSIGKWKQGKRKTIILDSKYKDVSIPLKINNFDDIVDKNIFHVKLKINDGESLDNYFCRVYINDTIYSLKRCDSLNFLTIEVPIKSIYFMFIKEPLIPKTTYIPLPLISNKFIPKEQTKNYSEIKIEFSDEYFYYKPFNNELLKIQENGLEIYNTNRRKWKN